MSLAGQMESYYASMPDMFGKEWGWDVFEKESYAFKHDKADVQKRIAEGGAPVSTADVARLLEHFQSALLKYWDFEPKSEAQRKREKEEHEAKAKEKEEKSRNKADGKNTAREGSKDTIERGPIPTASKEQEIDLAAARTVNEKQEREERKARSAEKDEPKPPPKKVPVLFLDEAHKVSFAGCKSGDSSVLTMLAQLPALIQSDSAMKTILDSMLVLTKQDRLCHVIHATSDPFYMHWLRQMNVMQHANILSIGDCSYEEARDYFENVLKQRIPEKYRDGLTFEHVYRVVGSKLAHMADSVTEYINSDGKIMRQSIRCSCS